jgi:hypothetical protein
MIEKPDALAQWHPPVHVSGIGELSVSSSRIDILSPLLDLRNLEEDLVLDMHYSLTYPRVWNTRICATTAANILDKIKRSKNELRKAFLQRVPSRDPEIVLSEWQLDLMAISLLDSDVDVVFSRTKRA